MEILISNPSVEQSLRIEAGSTLKFTDVITLKLSSSNYGTLIANGTATEPITFTTAAPTGAEQQVNGMVYSLIQPRLTVH
jgi:hypothetical protein